MVINEISIKGFYLKQFEEGVACGGSQVLGRVIEDSWWVFAIKHGEERSCVIK